MMILELFHFSGGEITWLFLDLYFIGFWICTERWWSHGNEFVIGLRVGKKMLLNKRWELGE